MIRRAALVLVAVVVTSWLGAALANGQEKGNVKGKPRSFLFVQNARHGTFTAIRGKAGRFRLALRDVDPHVLFFTDRPARDTGLLSQKAVMGALFAKGLALPNAAVEVIGGPHSQDVLAVRLSKPSFNERRRTLSYEAATLPTLSGPGLRHYRGRLDRRLPASFGAVSLFIDTGTAWGNTCQANVTNNTGQNLVWQSEDKWSTDTWQEDPAGTGIPPDGNSYNVGYTTGGFARGCHNSTNWTLDDGTSVNFDTTDPYSGGNTLTCTTSNPSKYQCTLGSASVIHGPILYLVWTLSRT